MYLVICFPQYSFSEVDSRGEFFFLIDSYSYSAISPIAQLYDDLKGPPVEPGDFAFTSNRYEIGTQVSAWRLSYLERFEYYLQFTPDTAEVFHADKNKLNLEEGRLYDIHLRGRHLRARGAKAEYTFSAHENININASLTYLRATKHLDGVLHGSLFANNDSVEGDLDLDYTYTRDLFFNRGENQVVGRGFAADLSMAWEISPILKASLLLRDVASRINWDGQYHTVADATSNTINYGEDGSLNARPFLAWVEREKHVKQRLPRQYQLNTHYQLAPKWQLNTQLFRYDVHDFKRVGVTYLINPSHKVSSAYDVDARSLTLGYEGRYGFVTLSSDSFEFDRAHAFGLSVGFSFRW